MRTITVHIDEDWEQDATCVRTKQTDTAIGYLSMWAIHNPRYSRVSIALNKDGNILAEYYNGKEDAVTYSLFALRDDDGNYSFHS